MNTSKTSLGEGGKIFSMQVKRNAARRIPSMGRACKNTTSESIIINHNQIVENSKFKIALIIT
jgi:hypothetical protein